jgi:hypothetical protein
VIITANWERPGGTTFRFVNDGIETALAQAREAAGDRDVRIAGGGATILEYVNAGRIDEFTIALSPVLFGSGIRLFEGVDAGRVALSPVRAEPTQRVTHLTYAVRKRSPGRLQAERRRTSPLASRNNGRLITSHSTCREQGLLALWPAKVATLSLCVWALREPDIGRPK